MAKEKDSKIEVRAVTNRRDMKRFVRFPTRLYADNAFYVHPLEVDEMMLFSPRNPAWECVTVRAFLAYSGKTIVGRIAVIIQKQYNEKHNTKYARFTRFDFVDDKAVSAALMNAAVDFARSEGMDHLHGPLGFNDMDKEGLLVEGFDRLATFAEVYNYAYYKNHIEELGFQKEVDWLEFVMKIPTALDDRLVRISEGMVKRLNLHFLPKNVSTREIVDRYGQEVFDVLDICYADLHGVVPSTPKVRASILKQFKQIIRREFISMVFNAEGRVVGFALTAPNISRSLKKSKGRLTKFGFWPSGALRIMREARRPKHIDMCLIAVLPEYRGKGINAMMINELTLAYIEHKIVSIETNLELETNENVMNQFEHMERKLIKRRRCYSKSIANK